MTLVFYEVFPRRRACGASVDGNRWQQQHGRRQGARRRPSRAPTAPPELAANKHDLCAMDGEGESGVLPAAQPDTSRLQPDVLRAQEELCGCYFIGLLRTVLALVNVLSLFCHGPRWKSTAVRAAPSLCYRSPLCFGFPSSGLNFITSQTILFCLKGD